jgi:hypothetical protein
VSYDRWPLDTLYVEIFGAPRPGYYVPVEPGDRPTSGLSVKVSEDDATVVGVTVQAYLAWAESRWPFWLDLAPLAGIPEPTLDAFGLTPPATTDRDQAIGAFLTDVRAAWDELVRAEAGQAQTRG